jgi:general secretion pathway protein J
MKKRGFTLIEVMVACGILAMVTTLVWGTFKGTFRTKAAVEAQSARYRTVRIALTRFAREVSMSYVSQNEDTGQADKRTLFAGKRKNDVDELRFSYFGHQRLYQDANESDTAQIYYFGQRDREDGRKLNLMRRETRRLQYQKAEMAPGATDIACDDVVRLKLEYWDARDKQWREEWNTTAADGQPDRLPSRVRITLTVHDERGKEVPFTTEARIALSEPLFLRAVEQQAPTGTPGAPGTTPGTTPKPGTTPTTPSTSPGMNPIRPGAF